jgi:hypothetical protein
MNGFASKPGKLRYNICVLTSREIELQLQKRLTVEMHAFTLFKLNEETIPYLSNLKNAQK